MNYSVLCNYCMLCNLLSALDSTRTDPHPEFLQGEDGNNEWDFLVYVGEQVSETACPLFTQALSCSLSFSFYLSNCMSTCLLYQIFAFNLLQSCGRKLVCVHLLLLRGWLFHFRQELLWCVMLHVIIALVDMLCFSWLDMQTTPKT